MPYFRIRQGNLTVAKVSGPLPVSESEILHYAMQYRQDGDITIQRQERCPSAGSEWFWKRHIFMAKWPAETAVK